MSNDTSIVATPVPIPAVRSPRSRIVADAFGLTDLLAMRSDHHNPFDCDALRHFDALLPEAGKIVLITGPSGAGKSSLLRALRHAAKFQRARWIDLAKIRIPDRPIVDCFGRRSLTRVLEMLSRVGLAEAWTYLRTPGELSEGQRWRLRFAIALSRCVAGEHARRLNESRKILVCDEFAAMLDRVTAAIVARTLRRVITSSSMSVIVATSHDDLIDALQPEIIVSCDFGVTRVARVEPASMLAG